MTPYLATVATIAHSIPTDLAAHRKAYRGELARRLTIRGWRVQIQVKLEPGSRGDDTYSSGRLELVCHPPQYPDPDNPDTTPPIQPPPVLVQIERNPISYRTRAKLQSWGRRPTSGKLVLQLYAKTPDPIPEADLVLALAHRRRRTPQAAIQVVADLRRFSHAVGVNEARYQIAKQRMLQARRDAGGRPGMRAKALAKLNQHQD